MRHRLSFFLHVHRWDRDRQRAKATSREAANLNLRLAEIERGVEAFFTRADLDGRQPAREEAARALRELCGGAETSTRITQPVRRVTFRGSRRVEEVVAKCNLVSTHTARRTFVVTALTLGVPAKVVMRWTGHSDWASMRPYVAIVDELKKKEMGKFDEI